MLEFIAQLVSVQYSMYLEEFQDEEIMDSLKLLPATVPNINYLQSHCDILQSFSPKAASRNFLDALHLSEVFEKQPFEGNRGNPQLE